MSEKNVLIAAKIDYLVDYAKKQFKDYRGLHLNSKDWEAFINIGTAQFYSFIINGIIKFYTVSSISGKRYNQIFKFTQFKLVEPVILLLFLTGQDIEKIIDYIGKFLSLTETKIFCPCKAFCLEENTSIDLANGQTLTIKEMYEIYQNGKDQYVYSIDDNNNSTISKINKIWISGKVDELIKITLDNGKFILTTPEHYYIKRDDTNIMAKDLNINDSLMPIYKVKNIEYIKLESPVEVYDLEVKNNHNFYVSAGIVLHNSYWGSHYNLTKIKSAYGPGEIRPPDVRDPKRNNLVCKHLWIVLRMYEKYIREFAKGMIPYYKRQFGINSPTGVERLKKILGMKGFKKIVVQAIKNLHKINDKELLAIFNELTDNQLQELLTTKVEIPSVPKEELNKTPEQIKEEAEEQLIEEEKAEVVKPEEEKEESKEKEKSEVVNVNDLEEILKKEKEEEENSEKHSETENPEAKDYKELMTSKRIVVK